MSVCVCVCVCKYHTVEKKRLLNCKRRTFNSFEPFC